MIEKIKELEIKKIPLDLSNLYNELDTIVNRKHEQLGARIYNTAETFSLLTSKLKPKLQEVLQKLNWLKKELQNLNSEDLLLCGIEEKSINLNKILDKNKINQIKEKIEELKSIKNELNQFEIDVRDLSF